MVFKFSWLLIEAEKDEDEEELDEEELGWLLFICLRYEGQVALTLISKRRIIDDLNGIEVEDIKYIIKIYFNIYVFMYLSLIDNIYIRYI